MGAAVGTDDKKSVNVDVNIVPFIDLLSCLTAFLLVTAAWVKTEQLDMRPKGKNRDSQPTEVDPNRKDVSVLIQKDQIIIGISRDMTFQPVARSSPTFWETVKSTLDGIKKSADFADREDMELAANSAPGAEVKYDDIVRVMDIAIEVGFKDVGLSDPEGLAAKPTL